MSTDLFRTVNKNEKNETRYFKYGFDINPFPNKPGVTVDGSDKRENGSIYIPDLRLNEINNFIRILIPKNNNAEPKSIAFLMDHATRQGRGIGKTAFLNYQNKFINKDFGNEISEGSEVLFSTYVLPIPNENYKKFYLISKLIIDSLIDQNIVSSAMCRLRALSGIIDEKVLEQIGDNDLMQLTIGDDEWLTEKHEELKISFNIQDLNSEVRSKLNNIDIDNLLCDRLLRFGCNHHEFKKYFFYPLKDSEWKKCANKLLFDDLVKLFKEAGFTKAIILFDELEKIIPHLNSLDRRSFCEEIRYYFIDGSFANSKTSFISLLLTIHPYLQELLNPHWEAAGLQRFASLGGELSTDYTIFFAPLDVNSAIPLAKAYMDFSRIESVNKDLMPFNEDSLKEALLKNYGVPGKFLTFLHSAIEKGIDENWNEITIDHIKRLAVPDSPVEVQVEDQEKLTETKAKLK